MSLLENAGHIGLPIRRSSKRYWRSSITAPRTTRTRRARNEDLRKTDRAENTALLGAGPVELDLEEYLCGVVPSEIYESSHMEALRAQAVAARTFAVKRAMAGTVVDDTTSFQAYRAPLAESSPRSRQAVEETAGQVLTYGGEVIDCFYSASNGGTLQTQRRGLEPGLSLLCEQA